MLASTRLVKPGCGVGLEDHAGQLLHGRDEHHRSGRIAADAERGVANGGGARIAAESQNAGPSCRMLRARRTAPMPFRPAERIVSSGKPACGTKRISIPRSVPTNTLPCSLPGYSHSRATASAGKTWPPVPPPAISSFKFLGSAASPTLACLLHAQARLLADVQEHAGGQQHHQQARAAVADERQRNSLGRHHPQHHAEIDQRLAQRPSP